MGITRGAAFIITEGQYFDVSSRLLGGWRPLGLPADWVAPIVMVVLALVFQVADDALPVGPRGVRDRRQRNGRAVLGHRRRPHQDVGLRAVAACSRRVSGVVLALVQGQGKADLATGYELDIIASAVVGGASLAGGRGSVMGAVLGTLIFGVLRNALPQIPGATFYDRLIVGLVVIVIVVMDQLLLQRSEPRAVRCVRRRISAWLVAVLRVAGAWRRRGCGEGGRTPRRTRRRGAGRRSCASPSFRRRSTSRSSTTRRSAPSGRRRSSATSTFSGTRPTSADQLKQKEILESFITQHVDGIAISALNGDFLTDTINRAVDAGIPVVTWDSDAPKSKRCAFYGVDDFASGRILGEQAVKLLNGKGKVAIITSVGATNLQRRLDGVREVLAKAPGHQDRRGLRHQGRLGSLRGAHRHRHEPLSGSRRVALGRRLAGVHAQRARRRSIRRRPR